MFNMGTGASFYVGKSTDRDQSPLNYRTNLALICSNDMTIYVVDCHNTQNQVRLYWRAATEQIWSDGRGPDLLDTDEANLMEHVRKHTTNEQYAVYFRVRIVLKYNRY